MRRARVGQAASPVEVYNRLAPPFVVSDENETLALRAGQE